MMKRRKREIDGDVEERERERESHSTLRMTHGADNETNKAQT